MWVIRYNFNNSDQRFLIKIKDQAEWEKESRIARSCGFEYRYLVGDYRHIPALEEVQPNFVPIIADAIEVDPVYCLSPDK